MQPGNEACNGFPLLYKTEHKRYDDRGDKMLS